MPKSKNRKGHKEKVAKRKKQMLDDKRKYHKFQQDMLQKLINAEREKGAFENVPSMTQINIPNNDAPLIQGPQI